MVGVLDYLRHRCDDANAPVLQPLGTEEMSSRVARRKEGMHRTSLPSSLPGNRTFISVHSTAGTRRPQANRILPVAEHGRSLHHVRMDRLVTLQRHLRNRSDVPLEAGYSRGGVKTHLRRPRGNQPAEDVHPASGLHGRQDASETLVQTVSPSKDNPEAAFTCRNLPAGAGRRTLPRILREVVLRSERESVRDLPVRRMQREQE